MKRRGNGEGSVRYRGDLDLWECRLVLSDGRRKSLYARTQREVLDKRKAELERDDEGRPAGKEKQTFAAYLADWLVSARPRLRPRTWIRYEELGRIHAAAIANVPLVKLGPQHLERLYARRLEAGAAPMTVRRLHGMLHKVLDQAEKWKLVGRNVAAIVSPPRAPRYDMRTLTEEQTRAFLETAAGERFEALYVLAVSTGMRQGEILALRWRDVDLERATLHVQQGVQFVGSEPIFVPPKTNKSRRKIELTKVAVAALRRQRARQIEERLAAAGAWQDNDLVFADQAGGVTKPDRVRWNFWRTLERADLPRIRFHDLRHTAATIALGRGVHPKIVSEMLGHSTIAITLDLYSHVTPTMQREAAAVFDAVLGGAQ